MTGHLQTHGPALLDGSYFILPILPGEKRPALKTWQDERLSHADLPRWGVGYGVGVMCGVGTAPVAAIDIDVSHPAVLEAVLRWCREVLGETCERIGAAPRILLAYRAAEAGWTKATSVAFFDPLDPVKPNGKPNEQRIEVLGVGQQFVAYHVHPDTGVEYQWTDFFGGIAYVPAADLPIITQGQIALLFAEFERIVRDLGLEVKGRSTAVATRADDPLGDPFAGLTPRIGLTLIQGAEYLTHFVNEDLTYDDWLNVGMALHHEFEGAPEALEMWKQWGATSSKDDPREYGYKWASFAKSGHRPLTFAFVIKRAKEAASKEKYTAQAEWKQRIAEAADDFTLREKVCPQLTLDIRLGEFEREALAQVLCDRFRALGLKMPIAQCRKLVAPRVSASDSAPGWLSEWLYLEAEDRFYGVACGSRLTAQAFDMRHNRLCPTDGNGEVVAGATMLARDVWHIETVFTSTYIPWAGPLFERDGRRYVNAYRPSSVPVAASFLSPGGQAAVELVRRHLELVCGSRPEVLDTLLAWLAHNVQKPGVKIRWAPLIKGVEGDGKTTIATLLAAVMGMPQVRNISPRVLGTDFTGWAEGSCVGVLEEVRIVGHSRHDIMNALKPFITNDAIEVHRKGVDSYEAANVTNYIAFTNFADALPLTDTDRRWWIVFTPWARVEDLAAAIGVPRGELPGYFTRLHLAIQDHAPDLRRWLLDLAIPATFRPNGPPPLTDEKLVMADAAASPEEQAVRELIAAGGIGFGPRVLSSACLTSAAEFEQLGFVLNTTAVNRVLTRLGWVKVGSQVKWNGQSHRVWTLGQVSHETAALRLELDATVTSHEEKARASRESESACDPLQAA